MKYILTISIILQLLCDCKYDGSYSKVEFDGNKRKFFDKSMDLGEINLSPNFTTCSLIKDRVSLKGTINNNNDNYQLKSVNLQILVINRDGVILDTLFDKFSNNFEIRFKKTKKTFIVIKQKEESFGLKFDISKFSKN
jgi:hypothetical protein